MTNITQRDGQMTVQGCVFRHYLLLNSQENHQRQLIPSPECNGINGIILIVTGRNVQKEMDRVTVNNFKVFIQPKVVD